MSKKTKICTYVKLYYPVILLFYQLYTTNCLGYTYCSCGHAVCVAKRLKEDWLTLLYSDVLLYSYVYYVRMCTILFLATVQALSVMS